ncbi:phosphoglycerate mutase-like protein 4 [Phragmites australis]|uniref:phosphoglycerate mutase-like protein 4 n=1 Tax=Phragmites australis TaxID=29695 RepID=UPI002D78ED6E|nr:phosphoglycerate mutase-like protein 4 [Phragmites australis]
MSWPLPTTTPLPPPLALAPSRVSLAALLPSPPPAVAAAAIPTEPASAPRIRRVDAPGAAPGMSSASSAEGEAAGEFTEVVIVRHGETSWNASRIIQGHLDAELNEIGRQQAVAVAHRLSKEVKPAAIYSSDLKRAAETAQTIARICNLPNVVFDPALRERHIGDLQGMKLQDAATQRPEAYKAFVSHKRNQQIPGGGESLDQLSERCVSCLCGIVEKHKGERVILVSHGGTIRELYRHASPTKPLHGKIHNTSVSVILVSGTTGRCIVKLCGDISHLQETGVLENAFGGDKASA